MSASKRRVLLSNLVGEANEIVLNNDDIRVNCFVCTGCLLEHEKSDADDLIKRQGVRSKIITPAMRIESSTQVSEYVVPPTVVTPEEDLGVDAGSCEDKAGDDTGNSNDELVVCEECDAQLDIDKILEDIGVHESDDEININHYLV